MTITRFKIIPSIRGLASRFVEEELFAVRVKRGVAFNHLVGPKR